MMSQDEDHSGVHVSTADCWPLRDGAVSCSLVLVLEVAALCPAFTCCWSVELEAKLREEIKVLQSQLFI